MIANPIEGSRVKAVPRPKRLIANIPEVGVIVQVSGHNPSYGHLIRVRGDDGYTQVAWSKDYECVEAPDPHALFRDHYL